MTTLQAAKLGLDDPLLTTEEGADYVGESRRTWEARRVKGGGPEFIKIGSSVRYRKSAIEQWLAENTRRSTADPGDQSH